MLQVFKHNNVLEATLAYSKVLIKDDAVCCLDGACTTDDVEPDSDSDDNQPLSKSLSASGSYACSKFFFCSKLKTTVRGYLVIYLTCNSDQ